MSGEVEVDFSVDLSFVDDGNLQRLVCSYHQQGVASFKAGSYLGAIVCWGGELEGVLTWALLSRRADEAQGLHPERPIDEWPLSWLISAAMKLQLIGSKADGAAWAVKDFRNFIHPYKLIREQTSSRADKTLSLNALTAVQEILRSLKGRLSATPAEG